MNTCSVKHLLFQEKQDKEVESLIEYFLDVRKI